MGMIRGRQHRDGRLIQLGEEQLSDSFRYKK